MIAQVFWSFLLLNAAHGLVHELMIRNDPRDIFMIQTFGFVSGGIVNITVNDFSLTDVRQGINSSLLRVGFILRKSSSESSAQQDLEMIVEQGACILNNAGPDDYVIDFSKQSTWKHLVESIEIKPGSAGLYSLIFARCRPAGPHYATFRLSAIFRNPGPNYLSAGDAPLPIMYLTFFVLFSLAFLVWCWVLVAARGSTGGGRLLVKVHHVHYMMAVLLALKTLSLLFEGIRYHYISVSGASELAEAWSIVFYIFAFLKGVMLFTVILLIGSGWSLMKGYLHDREKKIILVVLSLQVVDNIAMVVLEETARGSRGWLTWRDLLHLLDIMCCCAILFPIVWSIRHLRQAAEADGKAQSNLAKLQLFRQFYVMVVAYIYFTRIIVFLLAATIPFHLLWLGPLFTELATLVFFVVTGFKFRPAPDNPYFPVRSEDGDGDGEYGLRDDNDNNNSSSSMEMADRDANKALLNDSM
eukprot:gene5494-11063_t